MMNTSEKVSGMMNARNEINGGVLSVTTEAANNLNTDDPVLNETLNAMAAMDKSLKDSGDPSVHDGCRERDCFDLFRSDLRRKKGHAVTKKSEQELFLQRRRCLEHDLSSCLS